MPSKPPLLLAPSLLKVIGVVILVIGLGTACYLDWSIQQNRRQQEAQMASADPEDAPLSPRDSRRYSHDTETFGGAPLLLMEKWSETWGTLKNSESFAITIALISLLAAAGCFIVARREPPL